jgi:hypothetical protein
LLRNGQCWFRLRGAPLPADLLASLALQRAVSRGQLRLQLARPLALHVQLLLRGLCGLEWESEHSAIRIHLDVYSLDHVSHSMDPNSIEGYTDDAKVWAFKGHLPNHSRPIRNFHTAVGSSPGAHAPDG